MRVCVRAHILRTVIWHQEGASDKCFESPHIHWKAHARFITTKELPGQPCFANKRSRSNVQLCLWEREKPFQKDCTQTRQSLSIQRGVIA